MRSTGALCATLETCFAGLAGHLLLQDFGYLPSNSECGLARIELVGQRLGIALQSQASLSQFPKVNLPSVARLGPNPLGHHLQSGQCICPGHSGSLFTVI